MSREQRQKSRITLSQAYLVELRPVGLNLLVVLRPLQACWRSSSHRSAMAPCVRIRNWAALFYEVPAQDRFTLGKA